ncbi:hypothetical protein CIB48_g1004 [Xylaria polymorpha]|nr:hypothetical protein CIB48_g1004 [Xylaria polymorpha]
MSSMNTLIGSNGGKGLQNGVSYETMHSQDEVIDNNVAGTRSTFIPVSRDQWTGRQFQTKTDTRHLSPAEIWIYDDQSTSGPYQ